MLIPDRIRLWRDDAAVLRRRGARRAADLMERLAAELEADLDEAAPALVDLHRAAELSRYTRGHLRRMMDEGRLTNHGTKAKPLFRAAELPRKPARRAVATPVPASRPTARDLLREVLRPAPTPTTRASRQRRSTTP